MSVSSEGLLAQLRYICAHAQEVAQHVDLGQKVKHMESKMFAFAIAG